MAAEKRHDKDGAAKADVERKVSILEAYMSEEDQQRAVDFARASLAQKEQASERDISQFIKQEADRELGPGRWHCAYGRSFGSFVTYEAMKMVHFTLGQHHVLLWKHG